MGAQTLFAAYVAASGVVCKIHVQWFTTGAGLQHRAFGFDRGGYVVDCGCARHWAQCSAISTAGRRRCWSPVPRHLVTPIPRALPGRRSPPAGTGARRGLGGRGKERLPTIISSQPSLHVHAQAAEPARPSGGVPGRSIAGSSSATACTPASRRPWCWRCSVPVSRPTDRRRRC